MKQTFVLIIITMVILLGCYGPDKPSDKKLLTNLDTKEKSSLYSEDYKAKNKTNQISCKLTSPELQKRKETFLMSLKEKVLAKKELVNGYTFRFPGTDKVLDELYEFIKTERACCDFFVFGLIVNGDGSEIWLELTGPEGVKDFIVSEFKI